MVITRSAFESIERNFPIASRLVLENLKRRSEAQVGSQLPPLMVGMQQGSVRNQALRTVHRQ